MANVTQNPLAIPTVSMNGGLAYASGATITFPDGTTVVQSAARAGTTTVDVPLGSVPAAKAAGFTRLDNAPTSCRLLQVPTGDPVFSFGSIIAAPDGITQLAIGATGLCVVPAVFAPTYRSFGWTPVRVE